MSIELIGWANSAILLATLMRQVYTQSKSQSIAGVSKWLFIGQLAASTGDTIYRVLHNNWVFLSSNIAILCTAVLGRPSICAIGANAPLAPARKITEDWPAPRIGASARQQLQQAYEYLSATNIEGLDVLLASNKETEESPSP